VISDRQCLGGQIWRNGPQWEVTFARCSGIAVAVNRRREGLAVGAVERRDNTVVVAYTAMMGRDGKFRMLGCGWNQIWSRPVMGKRHRNAGDLVIVLQIYTLSNLAASFRSQLAARKTASSQAKFVWSD
jgi:hypothetical protein